MKDLFIKAQNAIDKAVKLSTQTNKKLPVEVYRKEMVVEMVVEEGVGVEEEINRSTLIV